MLTQIATDLTAWTRLLALAGDAAVLAACEPKALRYGSCTCRRGLPTVLVEGRR